MLWAGDTRIKLIANIAVYGGDVALVTVTAPGVDALPWEDDSRTRVAPAAAWAWNQRAPRNWSRMNRRAGERTRRHCGRGRTLVARSWEYQRRGVLHVHLVLGMRTAAERHAAHVYVAELAAMRGRYGFGFVDRGKRSGGQRRLESINPIAAASYVAKYLSPVAGDGKLVLAETVQRADVPPNVVYVSRKLAAISGVTIRSLRSRRVLFMRARAAGYRVVDSVTGEVAPLAVTVDAAPTRGP